MLLRVVNKLSRILGRLPDIDDHETAVPYLNAVFEHVMHADRSLRAGYTWAMVQSAFLASALDVDRISALEFGVAGGNGLLALERAAMRLGEIFGVEIDVYGFDSGQGLPPPRDYRDLPNLWSQGAYTLDEPKLRAQLQRAELVMGLVEETVGTFLEAGPAPVGFAAFDLDHYTSTMQAFHVLEAEHRLLMPRIHCYFDDILGYTCGHHNGERLAIAEFNEAHPHRQISRIYGLRYCLHRKHREANWTEKMFMAHIVEHPLYNEWDGLLRRAHLDLKAA